MYWLVDMVETEHGSAGGIYAKIKETFLQHSIPMSNIIGSAIPPIRQM